MYTDDCCLVAPSPALAARLRSGLEELRRSAAGPIANNLVLARSPRAFGFNDGTILPPSAFAPGTLEADIRSAAAVRAPLRGTVRVVVVLVDFSDQEMAATAQHFEELFFSSGVLPHGSVRDYYQEVTGGLIDIEGQVVGPFRMPKPMAWYANGNHGIGQPSGTTRARDLARHAAVAADPSVDFGPFDNDGNGFVDAFVVVHAGRGGEETGDGNDLWSHKWVLRKTYNADTSHIYAYLTIPEDAKLGVCAHELGHLLFGFPDLYDTDYSSEGIGNWCLMAGGSWNGGGEIPAHPSAWCKASQGWAEVVNIAPGAGQAVELPDVKDSRTVHRVWTDGVEGPEYFLLENRQRTRYDAELPGEGLLVWHIDDNQADNTDESHYKIALCQADGKRDLEGSHNRGDAGDPYPGTAGNTCFTHKSAPTSDSYLDQPTNVSLTDIARSEASDTTVTVTISAT